LISNALLRKLAGW